MLKIDKERLHQAIADSGLGAIEVQRAANITPSTMYRLINHGGNVRLNTVGKVARVLSVPVNAITREV